MKYLPSDTGNSLKITSQPKGVKCSEFTDNNMKQCFQKRFIILVVIVNRTIKKCTHFLFPVQ